LVKTVSSVINSSSSLSDAVSGPKAAVNGDIPSLLEAVAEAVEPMPPYLIAIIAVVLGVVAVFGCLAWCLWGSSCEASPFVRYAPSLFGITLGFLIFDFNG